MSPKLFAALTPVIGDELTAGYAGRGNLWGANDPENALRLAARNALKSGEIAVNGLGHAEVTHIACLARRHARGSAVVGHQLAKSVVNVNHRATGTDRLHAPPTAVVDELCRCAAVRQRRLTIFGIIAKRIDCAAAGPDRQQIPVISRRKHLQRAAPSTHPTPKPFATRLRIVASFNPS